MNSEIEDVVDAFDIVLDKLEQATVELNKTKLLNLLFDLQVIREQMDDIIINNMNSEIEDVVSLKSFKYKYALDAFDIVLDKLEQATVELNKTKLLNLLFDLQVIREQMDDIAVANKNP